ncbi:DUF202 domain-containing protein [Actinomadura latina]|uniref:DUF202 domain-containing protein n=1 Tax=Actinomadura latina TaxID=163603 RepID=A0A846YZJ9_9ACTN|nr:DUF202 domain-containing protein [Actinomadura latina]NKZ05461.1 DUF202 domain-containing protein [Actinomadura latina]
MIPEDVEDLDPGLARERTELAWFRTAVSFAAVGGAMLKTAPVVGGLVLGMSALVYLLGRVSRPAGRVAEHARRRALLLITVAVTVVSAVALATVFLASGSLFPLP